MILALDTSCYTTSLAVINERGEIELDRRIVLEVKSGEKGLQQSAAIFQHLGNLPKLFTNISTENPPIQAVAVSKTPRPVEGSYLPVFKAGASFGESLAEFLKVPLIATSHQEGHIRAGLYQKEPINKPFLAWHISGGTTELLKVLPGEEGYQIEKIGGSSDLQVGQFIDRVGVALGLPFPAGPFLEKLANQSKTDETLSIVKQGLTVSFSGPESAAQRLIQKDYPAADIARQVFNTIGKSLWKVTQDAVSQFQIDHVLWVGGVASNNIIREMVTSAGEKQHIQMLFAAPNLSSDNAVGVGLIGFDYFKRRLQR